MIALLAHSPLMWAQQENSGEPANADSAAKQPDPEKKPSDYSHLKGKKVVIKDWNTKFRLPEGVVGIAELGNVYTIDLVKNDWLWVTDAGGWLTANDVVALDRADDYFSAVVKKKGDSQSLFERGMARLRMGKFQAAMTDLDRAAVEGKRPEYFNGRGVAFAEAGHPKKAIDDHTTAIKLNPKMSSAYYNRGNAWRSMGEYDKAISDYNLAIHLNPNNGRAFINRGLSWNKKQEFEKAKSDFNDACELNPKWPLAFNNRAESKNRLRDYDSALADCDKALKLNPKMIWAVVNRGNSLRGLGRDEEAMKEYDRAIKMDSTFAPAYHNRANMLADQGKYDEAIKDYEKAIELDSQFAFPCNGLAWVLATCPNEELRDPKRALELAERAYKLDDSQWNHLGTLAAAQAANGNWDEAVKAQKTSIKMLPSSATDQERADCETRLELFESHQPYHVDA